MKKSDYLILFILGLLVSYLAAWMEPVPGYMDAEYYFSGGLRLAEGNGFTEQILWNYLDQPQSLPHPSHTYWMPLPSVVAAAGMLLTGSNTFLAARLFFILLAACLPLLTALMAASLGQQRRNCLLSGLLAVFPGIYLIYSTNVETFTLYMILGGLFILASFWKVEEFRQGKIDWYRYFGLGIITGLMHLTRAEGMVWLFPAGVLGMVNVGLWFRGLNAPAKRFRLVGKVLAVLSLILVGYGLVMSPWFIRNLKWYGSITAPGGSRTIWLLNYNQTFVYWVEKLNFNHWLAAGWKYHLDVRWAAFLKNLQTTFLVEGEFILFPLMILGLWKLRKKPQIWMTAGMWGILIGIMTIVFPFSGSNGGFFHSSSALQTVFWAAAPVGLDALIGIGEKKRNWNAAQSKKVFGLFIVVVCILSSAFVYQQRVIGGDLSQPVWRASWDEQVDIERALVSYGALPGDIVMINNPPGSYAATGRPSIVIPDENEQTIIEVGSIYDSKYLVLQKNSVDGLLDLYKHPKDRVGLKYLGAVDQAYIFQFVGH